MDKDLENVVRAYLDMLKHPKKVLELPPEEGYPLLRELLPRFEGFLQRDAVSLNNYFTHFDSFRDDLLKRQCQEFNQKVRPYFDYKAGCVVANRLGLAPSGVEQTASLGAPALELVLGKCMDEYAERRD